MRDMSSDCFEIKICTPAGLIAEESVQSVTLPGIGGELGVLPHHRNYVGILEGGIISYTPERAAQPRRMLISGGVCSFVDDTLTVLADQVEGPEDIDRQGYAKERPALIKLLSEGSSEDQDRIDAAKKLRRIENIDKMLAT